MEYESGRDMLMALYDIGFYELIGGRTLTELQENVFIKLIECPEFTYSEIAEELKCEEGVARNIGSYLFSQISTVIGMQISKRSNYKQYIIDYLSSSAEDSSNFTRVLRSPGTVGEQLTQLARQLSNQGVCNDEIVEIVRDALDSKGED
jgi:hypothetical protein